MGVRTLEGCAGAGPGPADGAALYWAPGGVTGFGVL